MIAKEAFADGNQPTKKPFWDHVADGYIIGMAGGMVFKDDPDYPSELAAREKQQAEDDAAHARLIDLEDRGIDPDSARVGVARSDEGTKQPVVAKTSNTPRDVAVMSNAVVSFAVPGVNPLRVLLEVVFRNRAKRKNQWDNRFATVSIPITDLARAIGLTYRLTEKAAEDLVDKVSEAHLVHRRDGVYTRINCISRADFDHKTGMAYFKLSDEVAPYFINLRRKYRQLTRKALKLRSKRSMLLYLHARKYVGLRRPEHNVPLSALHHAMQVSDEIDWAAFNKDILKPAVEEVNRKTEIHIAYNPERFAGRQRGAVNRVTLRVTERRAQLVIPLRKKAPPAQSPGVAS